MDKLTTKEERELRKKEKLERDEAAKRKQKTNSFLIWGGIAVVLIGSVFVIFMSSGNASPNQAAQETLTPVQNLTPVSTQDMTRGPKDAKVTLIEYADFQCPACKYYHPIVNQLYSTYQNKVRFVYRFFPLVNLHEHAMVAAEAAYAASLQGKFWQMGDQLFDNQDTWATAGDYQNMFDGYAQKLGLNVTQFDNDMQAPDTAKIVNAAEDSGIKIGVQGTPTFILDSKLVVTNPPDYDSFKKLIDQELQKQK